MKNPSMSFWVKFLSATVCLLALVAELAPARGAAPLKVLMCTGDYGMWAQDRAKLIQHVVDKTHPGQVVFKREQTINFVKKLEAPGYARQYDVIVCGDVALGQMTTRAQQAIVHFVQHGGGFIYVVWGKSTIPFQGPLQAQPMPLAKILPYKFFGKNPTAELEPGTKVLGVHAGLFKGLNFAGTPVIKGPLALRRKVGKGRVLALLFGPWAAYNYVSYATFKLIAHGWDVWPDLGKFWYRVIHTMAATSPIRHQTWQQVRGAIHNVPLNLRVNVNANQNIDVIRAADFSIVALEQLYVEDGGGLAKWFFRLNPQGFYDRISQEALLATGKIGNVPTSVIVQHVFAKYHMKGIIMGDDSYGSYASWSPQMWKQQIKLAIMAAKKFPQYLKFLQPGNEPPCWSGYFKFHNRYAKAILAKVPSLKVIGPNTAFNVMGPNVKAMKAYIAACGKYTDILNWHIYAVPPGSEKQEVLYWTKYARGKLRSKGPVHVMFTESDAWNTGNSQFNYLMDRAYTFLPMKQILACFQYCMDPRYEGGTYWFGVLQPKGKFEANYNGYWVWRNLRGNMVAADIRGATAMARGHCHVLASSNNDGKIITVVLYYDTGYFDGFKGQRSNSAHVLLKVKLPPGQYKARESSVDWNTRTVTALPGIAQGVATARLTLQRCHAAAITWVRQ